MEETKVRAVSVEIQTESEDAPSAKAKGVTNRDNSASSSAMASRQDSGLSFAGSRTTMNDLLLLTYNVRKQPGVGLGITLRGSDSGYGGYVAFLHVALNTHAKPVYLCLKFLQRAMHTASSSEETDCRRLTL